MNIDKMNDDEYSSFCLERYKPFFDYLNSEEMNKSNPIKYYIFNKMVYVKIKQTVNDFKYLIFKNIELPPNISFYITNEDNIDIENQIILQDYPAKTLPQQICLKQKIKQSFNGNVYLNIKDSPKLQELPDNFKLNGGLIASKSAIKKIGKNNYIEKSLILNKSDLEEIGDNLVVHGDLDINKTKIQKINKTMNICGNICICCNSDLVIPDNFVVNGNLLLNYSSIKKMGKYITIKGDLYLNYSNLTKLPNRLTIHGSLKSNGSNLTKLPNDILIFDTVNINNHFFKKLPKILINSRYILLNENLFTENINIFYKTSSYNKNTKFIPNIFNKYFVNKDHIIDMKKLYSLKCCESEIFIKNNILYNVDNPLQKKLLLLNFNKITKQEIQKFIEHKNSYVLLNNTLKKGNKQEDINNKKRNIKMIIKGRLPMIYYCRSKQAFEFLYKNNYNFTQEEYDTIPNKDLIKGLYEMYLLKYNSKKELPIISAPSHTKSKQFSNMLLNNKI